MGYSVFKVQLIQLSVLTGQPVEALWGRSVQGKNPCLVWGIVVIKHIILSIMHQKHVSTCKTQQ